MKKSLKGFTLIELVIVIVLVGVIAAVASKMLSAGFDAFLRSSSLNDAGWQGRIAIDRMSRDIQAIRSTNDINASSTSSSLIFTDTNGTTITYQLTGTSLMRNTQILADGISTLTFNYFDSTGAATTPATPTLIRYITMTINITQGNVNYSLITTINPRNIV